MSAHCSAFREDELERLGGAATVLDAERDHASNCEPCRRWLQRSRLQARVLGELSRFDAPRELAHRIRTELAPDAPAAAHVLRDLARHRAPRVLERLVREELAQPEAARSRRFAGDLERQSVPIALDTRLDGSPGRGPRRLVTRVPLSLIGLAAAAAVVVWLGFPGATQEAPTYGFTWRQVETLDEMPAESRALFGALSGGMVSTSPGGESLEGGF